MLPKSLAKLVSGSLLAGERSARMAHTLPASYLKVNHWNKSISEAESLVGYPTSYMAVRALFNDDFTNMAVHLRKLIGSDHPVLKTAKRLLYNGKNNMQVRGLLVLLLSRAAGPNGEKDLDSNTGVLDRQRKLAEIIEMIHSAQSIHQSVMNIPVNVSAEPDAQIRTLLSQLEYGNKISILSGDYLLANASVGLASLRVTEVVELVSIAIADFTQSEFLGAQDSQGRVMPTRNQLSQECWESRWRMGSGSLLSAGCKGAMLISQQSKEVQEAARLVGVHTALAIQAYDEMRMFTKEGGLGSGAAFSLCSAPVLFHLQNDPELLEYISQFHEDLLQVDYKRVLDSVCGGEGVEQARQLSYEHAQQALAHLRKFEDNEGRRAFHKILESLSS